MDSQTSWLMVGDPAIRWQTQRDLFDEADSVWMAERDRVGNSGWGLRLLGQQESDGFWGGGLYNPKWTSTTYTLLLLFRLGLAPGHPAALKGCQVLLDGGAKPDGGIDFSRTTARSETCITGIVTSISSWFDVDDDRVEAMVDYLLTEQMPDGGWNCMRWSGATHSSFHTTISALEGLAEYCRPKLDYCRLQPEERASPNPPLQERRGNPLRRQQSVSPNLAENEQSPRQPPRQETVSRGPSGNEQYPQRTRRREALPPNPAEDRRHRNAFEGEQATTPNSSQIEQRSCRPRHREAVLAGARGREFLLNHRLYKSHRTGAVVDSRMTRFSFPPRWYYDVLRSLDHFQAVGAEPDTRADDAIALVLARQRSDGRWPLQNTHRGKVFFDLETAGEPSRWNTLRALRVLRWLDGGDRQPQPD